MHTLRQFLPLAVAFTLGAALSEIQNLRDHDADMLDRQAQILQYEHELSDLRVDIEINYLDGYREGTGHLLSGYSTSQRAPIGHTVSGLTK